MKMKWILSSLALLFPLAAAMALDMPDRPDLREAMAFERELYSGLYKGNWSAERLREATRDIATMREEVAIEMLWQVACLSPRMDTISFFANALLSTHVSVRSVSLRILSGKDTADSHRIILNTLSMEREADVAASAINGLAHLPLNRAVTTLVEVVLHPGMPPMVVKQAGEVLRRLTKTGVADNPGDWRAWWLDNESYYNR